MGAKLLVWYFALLTGSQLLGARLPQIAPLIVLGGPEEGIHFRAILTLSSLDGVGGGDIFITNDAGEPVPAIFNGAGPTTSFVIRDPKTIITSPSREIQVLKAALDVGTTVVAVVRIQMLDGQRLVSEIEQRAVIPEVQRNPDVVAGVLPPLRGAAVPLDTRQSKDLGLVVLNPTRGDAQVQLAVKSARTSLNLQTPPLKLGPGKRLVGLLSDFFRESRDFLRDELGRVEIQSDRPILIAAIEIDWPELRSLPIFQLLVANEIFVSTSGNDNSGNGSRERPFRTLGRALQLAKSLSADDAWLFTGPRLTIRASGKFTPAGGDVFPLLVGAALESGTIDIVGATIEGGGDFEGINASLVVTKGAVLLKGSAITNPNPGGVGVLVKDGNLSVEASQFSGNTIGILTSKDSGSTTAVASVSSMFSKNRVAVQLRGKASAFIAATNFFSNGTAVEIRDQSGSELQNRFEGNSVVFNDVGVAIFDSATVDLGGGPLLGKGANIMRGNTQADVCHQGSSMISAKGNIWDNPVPSRSSPCSSGVDIGGPAAEKVVIE